MTMEELSGVLIVNKHEGVTSHDIVNKIRRLYHTRRVGHTGTLDPMATGVLVILIGRAAKACEYLSADSKKYRARLRLGITTDSEDVSGTVLTVSDAIPSNEQVQSVLADFRGRISQIPPMYSALKVGGQKLVDLARRGETVERLARTIELYELSAFPTENPAEYILHVHCSGGTYIRTLCADIGAKLGCGGVMAALERTETGGFPLTLAHTISELEMLSQDELTSLLIPIEQLFQSNPAISLPPFFETLCRNGCEIYLQKIGCSIPLNTRVRLCDQNGNFFALGEVGEYKNGIAVKAIKLFSL